MTRRQKVRALDRVIEVRAVQKQVAQMAVARSLMAVSQLGDRQDLHLETLRVDEQLWARGLGGDRLDLHAARLWFADVVAQEAELRATAARLAEAQHGLGRSQQAMIGTLGRYDAAGALGRAARRDQVRKSEENQLADLADRSAQRGSGR